MRRRRETERDSDSEAASSSPLIYVVRNTSISVKRNKDSLMAIDDGKKAKIV